MTPTITVAFHVPLSRTRENVEGMRELFENQTGLPAEALMLARTDHGPGTVWGFHNEVASLFFVEP